MEDGVSRRAAPEGVSASRGAALPELVAVMERLRAPGGCPWDREQTPESLRRYILEEAHELVEAIDSGESAGIREECGDLLLQVVFLADLAREAGTFDLDDVVRGIVAKLIRRHPHVFGDASVRDADEVGRNWERIKAAERREREADDSAMAGIPRGLPALLRALRIQERAAKAGFDWPEGDPEPVFAKVGEEIGEIREALGGDRGRLVEEVGDLLFAVTNLARHLKVEPESALQSASDKFGRRFRRMESLAGEKGESFSSLGLDAMEHYWCTAKNEEVGA
jgi:MazG family protein